MKSDENSMAKPVLVALSGGIDSFVAAYLLKIQKRVLFAVTVVNTPESTSWPLPQQESFRCHVDDEKLAAIQKFCDHLQIPLTVIRARDEFYERVVETWVGNKICGIQLSPCHECERFRMELMLAKMKELKCVSLATGHYAKLVHLTNDRGFQLSSSNDLEHDQSGQLLALPRQNLTHLELPLSELQKKEVVKIAQNFEIEVKEQAKPVGCLSINETMAKFIEERTDHDLLRAGEVIDVVRDSKFSTHKGFHRFEIGKDVPGHRAGQGLPPQVVGFDWAASMVNIAQADYWLDSNCQLIQCQLSPALDMSTPVRGFIHCGGGADDVEVLFVPQNFHTTWIMVTEGKFRFQQGERLTIFKRRGKNAKVLVTGIISGRIGREWVQPPLTSRERAMATSDDAPPILREFNF